MLLSPLLHFEVLPFLLLLSDSIFVVVGANRVCIQWWVQTGIPKAFIKVLLPATFEIHTGCLTENHPAKDKSLLPSPPPCCVTCIRRKVEMETSSTDSRAT